MFSYKNSIKGGKMSRGILVVGSLNMDMSVHMDAMPSVGETILGYDLSYQMGGKGANQACASGRLGGDVKMLGCVGQDEFGGRQAESLQAAGVDASFLKRSPGSSTGMAVIYVDKNGDNNIVVIQGANQECSEQYLREQDELFQWCDIIMLQMEIPVDAVLYAARRGRELGKTVILNPAPAPDHLPEELYGLVDYLTPNETELAKLSGVRSDSLEEMKRGARLLIGKGVTRVIVTLGEQGALLVDKESEQLYPSRKVNSVDTTAAGDCFNGALAVGLAEGMREDEAIRFANLAASLAVTRQGAQSSLPFRKEVEELRKQEN